MAAAEQRKAEEEQRAQQEAMKAALEAAEVAETASELASGECSDERHADAERALFQFKALMESLQESRRSPVFFRFIGSQITVAKPEGAALSLTPALNGEMHIFALGVSPVELEVTTGGSRSHKLRSTFESTAAQLTRNFDSRQFMAAGREPVFILVRGKGCVVVATFEKM
jgi:hypothetical protein